MNASILIVEDESIVALDLKNRLKKLGYDIIGLAGSSQAAVRLAEIHRPDLCLMDIRLQTDIDGIETARLLQNRFQIPIIYLTSYADDETLQRAKETEPYGYLVKPFEERELRSTVETALHRIHADKERAVQSAWLKKIVATVPDGVALLNGDFTLRVANGKAKDYLEALGGITDEGIVNHLGKYSVQELLEKSNSSVWHRIETQGRSPRIFEVNVTTVDPVQSKSLQETVAECVLVIRDVTEERKMEERVQQQERLATMGQFAAGIAHDFNNILTSIILNLDMLQRVEESLSPKGLDRITSMRHQSHRASELIKQILDFSRSSAMEEQDFDLVPAIKEVAKMLDRMLPESIQLQLDYPSEPCFIKGDATRMIQMIMNLALNARDAMPNGGKLCVALSRVSGDKVLPEPKPDGSEWICIQIIDDGIGIDSDALPYIFEPFYTTKTTGGGTGLGLSQVYGIVKQHDGQIMVSRGFDQGTSFEVFLPAAVMNPSREGISHPAEPTSLSSDHSTILVVEDQATVREGFCDILNLSGYSILEASNGREALEIVAANEYQIDLILSDLDMPFMNGLEMCRELRQLGNQVPVVIVSGYLSDDVRKELKTLSVIELLDKPVDVNQLISTVERAFAGSTIRQSLS